MADDQSEFIKLQQLLQAAIQQDESLREKYGVGDKFKFVRDKLQALLANINENIPIVSAQTIEQKSDQAVLDEIEVYVYLYNAQGLVFQSWRNLLTAKLLYEYSVNRPIYGDKNQLVSLIKSKANRAQHGFLTVKISQNDVLASSENASKDPMGNVLIKIREGSLKFNKLISFTHNDSDYSITADGEIKKL